MGNNTPAFNWKDKTILIVEDEHSNFYLTETYLLKSNATIVRALNGEEAVNICRSDQHIDLVLMDIKMPEMDGYDATRIIKNERPNLVIIALTAFALDGDREKTLLAGCDDYMAKPIEQSELLELLDKYL